MKHTILKSIFLLLLLVSPFKTAKAASTEDLRYAALGGLILGSLLCLPTYLLTKKNQETVYEKKIQANEKKHHNEIENLKIHITILQTKLEEQKKNNSCFYA